jgi:hypothetical protein
MTDPRIDPYVDQLCDLTYTYIQQTAKHIGVPLGMVMPFEKIDSGTGDDYKTILYRILQPLLQSVPPS